MDSPKEHLALFGNVAIPRAECPECGTVSLVLQGLTACCFVPIQVNPIVVKRESIPTQRRKLPPLADRRTQLEDQDYRCFYCFRKFDSLVTIKGKSRILRVNWDHIVPYVYDQDNRPINFVAACQYCNSWKSDKIFHTADEARVFLFSKWEAMLEDSGVQ